MTGVPYRIPFRFRSLLKELGIFPFILKNNILLFAINKQNIIFTIYL